MLKRLFLVLLFLGLVLGGIAAVKYRQMQQMAAMLSQPQPPAVVAVTEVRSESWQPTLHAVGSLAAVQGTDVTTEVAGKISAIQFESGRAVERGAVLIELDATVDRATLEGLKADRRLAEVQLSRSRDLLSRNAISKSQFDEAQAKYDAADAYVIEQEKKIARKRIVAPFSGELGIRQVDLGQYLSPGDRVVALQALDPIYVDYALPERHLKELRPGQVVEVRVDAYPDRLFRGAVSAVDPAVDVGTRSVPVRATLANPDGLLRPGMFAEVRTLHADKQPVLTVPRTAISFNTYGNYAFVVAEGENGLTVQRRPVTTGTSDEGRVEIVKGLQAGERVVRAGLVKLRDGVAVQIDNSVALDDAKVTQQ